ncbi:MAG: alpha/beta hydrolase [Clostridia bacterium]|nr:alpha/beta hydrolase [Clostridia bacterium]
MKVHNRKKVENEADTQEVTNKQKRKKPFYKRMWFFIVLVILLLVGSTALTMPFVYDVQNFIIKVICTPRQVSTPTNYEDILNNTSVIRDISYNSSYENGNLDIISPKDNTEELPLLVYFHGGYYVGGDKSGSEPYCRTIANEGYIVANANYMLAPEAQYPAQAIQANEAIGFLVDVAETYHIDVDNIFIGGDSAGAHLTGQMGAFYTNMELQNSMGITPAVSASQLKGVVLLCGFYDFYNVRETHFPLLNDAMWMYTGVKIYENFVRANELNTIDNVTASYPNTYLLCGDKDPFHSQNLQMNERLEELEVSITAYLPTTVEGKLKHEFQSNFELPEAYTAMNLLLEFLLSAVAI